MHVAGECWLGISQVFIAIEICKKLIASAIVIIDFCIEEFAMSEVDVLWPNFNPLLAFRVHSTPPEIHAY